MSELDLCKRYEEIYSKTGTSLEVGVDGNGDPVIAAIGYSRIKFEHKGNHYIGFRVPVTITTTGGTLDADVVCTLPARENQKFGFDDDALDGLCGSITNPNPTFRMTIYDGDQRARVSIEIYRLIAERISDDFHRASSVASGTPIYRRTPTLESALSEITDRELRASESGWKFVSLATDRTYLTFHFEKGVRRLGCSVDAGEVALDDEGDTAGKHLRKNPVQVLEYGFESNAHPDIIANIYEALADEIADDFNVDDDVCALIQELRQMSERARAGDI